MLTEVCDTRRKAEKALRDGKILESLLERRIGETTRLLALSWDAEQPAEAKRQQQLHTESLRKREKQVDKMLELTEVLEQHHGLGTDPDPV